MPRYLTIKDHARETHLFGQRAVIAFVIIVLLMLTIVSRLVYLQVINHEHYETLSHKNRVKIVSVPPTRGLIYDRNGVLLAENIPSFSLELTPEQVSNMDDTLSRLRKIIAISDEDIEHFLRLIKQKRRFDSVPLRFRLNEEEVARFAVNRYRFPGVDIEARLIRYYPRGKLGVHVIGYVGRIDETELQRIDNANYSATTHIGKLGVERSYEDILHGQVGFQEAEVNAQGRTLRILNETPAIPGKNLYLNIDIEMQALADRALGKYRGSIVAMAPKSGEVLTLLSKPGYDPNPFVTGIDNKSYQALRTSKDKPLFNRSLLGQYPPGSTVKPFIGLAGLEAGLGKQSTFCPGWYELQGDDHRYRDWKKQGHGETDLDVAIVESCDVYFYELAHRLKIDRIHDFMIRFGFGQKTGIDIIGELTGLMPSADWKRRERRQAWFPGETLITGIGQGFTLTTPLQLASATATLAMHGQRVQPNVLHATQASADSEPVLRETTYLKPIELKDPAHWHRIIHAMTRVMHSERGTARRSGAGAKYTIAGKTGTAQVFGVAQDAEYEAEELDERLRDHSLFIAFAPAEDPQIAIAVIAENAGSGSATAAPIARKLIDYYLLRNQ
ncbi:penicillin-binding protein 2 [Sulfuriflexus mobilis]|uniref:penicillin-binding protein 2 n=1 Tax=Sulfuriflexus mobilis TaxID=1811807 RepID=UPI000F83EB69|nr:penicillin-binding protein 2 [Sulfuriflexus mobilis]